MAENLLKDQASTTGESGDQECAWFSSVGTLQL